MTLVTFQNVQSFLMGVMKSYWQNETWVWRKNNWWVLGLKSKMCSIKNIDGKESWTAKGVSVATEFIEFKDTLSNKKILRHKMRRIQANEHKIGTCEIDK